MTIVTQSQLTLLLAAAIGAYATAAAAGDFLAPGVWRRIVDNLRTYPAMTFLAGIAAFSIGVTIVLVHHRWSDPLAIVVTLVGWLALLEGLALIAAPERLLSIAARMVESGSERWAVVAALAFGLVMLTLGLTGAARP